MTPPGEAKGEEDLMTRSPLLSTLKGWVALLAISAIPLLYSAFYLGAFWNPYGHLHRLPIALVNHAQHDEDLVQRLKKIGQAHLVNRWQAQSELANGTVGEIITIPAHYQSDMRRGDIRPLAFTVNEANNCLQALLVKQQIMSLQEQLAHSYQNQSEKATGVDRLGQDSHQLSRGLSTLTASSARLSSAARGLSSQAAHLAQQATGTALYAKLTSLSYAETRWASQESSLQSQLATLSKKSQMLAGGLDQVHRSEVVNPSQFGTVTIKHAVPQYGMGLAPYFLALSLWVGALVATVVIPGGGRQGLGLRTRASLGVAVLQVAILTGGILWILPISPGHPWAFWGAMGITGVAWWAAIRLLTEKLGDAGRIVAIALLVIQLSGSGGTYPMALSSALFRVIHPMLPMTWSVNLLRYTLSDGLAPSADTNFLRLVALLIGAYVVVRWIPGEWRFVAPTLEDE